MRKKVLQLVKAILAARRKENVKQEQKAYDALYFFCTKHNIDFDNALEGAKKELRKSIANQMNGFI